MNRIISTKRDSKTLRPELVLCPGPIEIGQAGAGSFAELYGSTWSLGLYEGDGPKLFQLSSEEWAGREDTEALEGLGLDAEHIALSFDQAARPVVAWSTGQSVKIRQWDAINARYQTRDIQGAAQPLLITDALCGVPVDDSDVLLFAVQDGNLKSYIQRENYNQGRDVTPVEDGTILDQVVSIGNSWQIFGASNGEQIVFLSESYPFVFRERVTGAAAPPLSGSLEPVIQVIELPRESISGQAEGIQSGLFLDVAPKVYEAEGVDNIESSTEAILSGEVFKVVELFSSYNFIYCSAESILSASAEKVVAVYEEFDNLSGVAEGPLKGAMYV